MFDWLEPKTNSSMRQRFHVLQPCGPSDFFVINIFCVHLQDKRKDILDVYKTKIASGVLELIRNLQGYLFQKQVQTKHNDLSMSEQL